MPASGPRLGREPAASEGSGICPGIMSNPATTAAVGWEGRGRGEGVKRGRKREKRKRGMIRMRVKPKNNSLTVKIQLFFSPPQREA